MSFFNLIYLFLPIDEFNNENVPPINVRIDFTKGEFPPPPPFVTLKIQDRSLRTTSHAIDVLTQNLEEIFAAEEKLIRQNQSPKLVPIDLHLNNLQLTLEVRPCFIFSSQSSDFWI